MKVSTRRHLVFVYGTLRKAGTLHKYMDGAKFIGDAEADGEMFSFGRFPGAHFGDYGGTIKGEIYQVNHDILDRLDGLEGYHPNRPEISMYVRRRITPRIEGVDGREVWVYEYRQPAEEFPRIVSGDWIQHTRGR